MWYIMDMKMILTGVVILFSINIVTLGLGLADETWLNKMDIFDQSYEDFQTQIDPVDINYTDVGGNSTATDSYDKLPVFESKEAISKYSTFKVLLLGMVAGYTAILVNIGLPSLIVWLLAGIIGIFQIMALFYFVTYILQATGIIRVWFIVITFLATKSLESIFLDGGALGFGSVALFGLVIVALIVFLMFSMNIPTPLILALGGFIVIGMFTAMSSNHVFKVILSIIAVIIGVAIALSILKAFNSNS